MTYRIPLPVGGRHTALDVVEPNSTAVQRFLRRDGLSAYEPPTVATLVTLFDQLDPGFTFFDVGANMGLYALLAASMFQPEVVTAFEPTPSTAGVLRKAVAANGLDVQVVEAALGDSEGIATLHLSAKSDASNSLVEGFKESVDSVRVQTIRLDEHVRRTGHDPQVLKIDVETFEPEVLAGARETIARTRPFIVVEVLNRRGHDHGEEITEAMESFGYSYYQLAAAPSWEPRPSVTGTAKSLHNDWLLAPRPLDGDFPQRWARWRSRLDACGPDRNSRVPLLLSARAAFRRGGFSEVVAAARRYL